MAFPIDMESVLPYIALLNTCIVTKYLEVLAPTLDFNIVSLKAIPYIEGNRMEIIETVKKCIQQAKQDWDSFETSWDFRRHPLV